MVCQATHVHADTWEHEKKKHPADADLLKDGRVQISS